MVNRIRNVHRKGAKNAKVPQRKTNSIAVLCANFAPLRLCGGFWFSYLHPYPNKNVHRKGAKPQRVRKGKTKVAVLCVTSAPLRLCGGFWFFMPPPAGLRPGRS